MNKIVKLTIIAIVISVSISMLSTSLFSDGHNAPTDASQQVEAEIKKIFGTVPVIFKVFPEHMRAGAWEWMKSTMSPEAAIPAKYSQLIALGVASQIPCNYCVYVHTTMAKMLGATEKEIQEAVASAADTRHWSTILNGHSVDFEEFKTEWDGIVAHLKKQSEVGEKLKRRIPMSNKLNEENSVVTVLIEVSYEKDTETIEEFIKEEQTPFIFEQNVSKLKRFEWFLDREEKSGTLIEVFADADGITEAAGKVMGTPVNLKFRDLFDIEKMTILGNISEELREQLAPLGPTVRSYAAGFSIAYHDKKDIRISIEKNIDDTGEEIVNVVATGSGSVTKEDIEKELEKLHAEKNIDISSGNVNIEINVEETK